MAPPYNYAQTIHVIPADQNFEKKRNSSALFAREINLVTQPSFDCEQGINSQVQTACSNADAVFPVLGIAFCKNERFSLSRKTHVPLWNEPRISHVRLLWAARTFRRLLRFPHFAYGAHPQAGDAFFAGWFSIIRVQSGFAFPVLEWGWTQWTTCFPA